MQIPGNYQLDTDKLYYTAGAIVAILGILQKLSNEAEAGQRNHTGKSFDASKGCYDFSSMLQLEPQHLATKISSEGVNLDKQAFNAS